MVAEQPSPTTAAGLRVGLFAVIEHEQRYLLARRSDNGWWNLPGGGMERGETVAQGLAREVREEVGVAVEITRLVGVYSKPQKNEVVLTFYCTLANDSPPPCTSDEVSEWAWFAPDALPDHLLPKHRQRIEDTRLGQAEALLRDQLSATEEDQGLKGM